MIAGRRVPEGVPVVVVDNDHDYGNWPTQRYRAWRSTPKPPLAALPDGLMAILLTKSQAIKVEALGVLTRPASRHRRDRRRRLPAALSIIHHAHGHDITVESAIEE